MTFWCERCDDRLHPDDILTGRCAHCGYDVAGAV